MPESEFITIGKIAGTHGYRGLLKVFPITDYPERFYQLTRVFLDNGKKIAAFNVMSCAAHKHYFIMAFQGIANMEDARAYTGSWLKIPEEEVYPLPEGVYYHFQLLGLNVYDQELGYLGQLSDILETGANDVYVVDSEQFGEILLPAIKEVILNIDLDDRKILVKLLPGLLEINR